MRQAFKIVLTALVGMALGSSCIKEDLSNCPPTQREVHTLKLTFVPNNMDITPTQADLKMAVVYLFDSTGKQIATWTKQNPVLNTRYDTGLTLDENTYRMVAWINPDAPYTITPAYTPTPEKPASRSDLTDGRVTLNIPQGGNVTDPLPMLFYGSAEQLLASTQDINVDIPLTLDTYRVNVTLKGIPQDGSTYRIQISDTNGSYDFNNNFIETPGFNYLNSATVGAGGGTGDLVLSLNTLRLDKGRAPMISIVNTTTGRTVFPQNGQPSVNLMDLINQTGVDLGKTHLINIEVPATPTPPTNGTNTTIVVNINGWNVVIDGGYNINPYE